MLIIVEGTIMQIRIFQVDAFASQAFSGNPAAVCPLSYWLDDKLLQQIAMENNLSETAFLVANKSGFDIRWFTPTEEVDLCGHATLAAAHVLFTHLGHPQQQLRFYSNSGELWVTRNDQGLTLDFPQVEQQAVEPPKALLKGLNGIVPKQIFAGMDYLVELESEQQLLALTPDFAAWELLDYRGVIVTAKGDKCDFVSRCFYPELGVKEDPVTGSAHCQLAPFWANKLDKSILVAKQLSTRGGDIICEVTAQRVLLTGHAVDYLQGNIWLEGA